ncbi:hypothetical protein POTOM_000447 [Populus tomentosa]|uniref:Uncharacterized protein n=1 Tax=Populus tomentosa TaxID=118781 RepID=A0A8X8DFL8_POPTO|nr:hypothetical protein POTOM_000447 [Populus tomentosa]
MACTSVLRSVLTTEPWMIPLHQNRTIIYYSLSSRKTVGVSTSKTPSIRSPEFHHFGRPRPTHANCFCSYNNNNNNEDDQDQDPPQEAVLKAISAYGHVLIETSVDDTEVSRTEGRVGQTTNVVIGGTVADDSTNEWLALDKKVNSYPTVRGFTAIGTGGDDFVQAMVIAVESVIQQPIPEFFQWHVMLARVDDNAFCMELRFILCSEPSYLVSFSRYDSLGKHGFGFQNCEIPHQIACNYGRLACHQLCFTGGALPNHFSSNGVQAVYNAMRRDDRMKYFL